ncbi:MAG: rod shape-determining protein [Desulfobacterales bacterium]
MLAIFKRMVTRPNIVIDLGSANTRIYSCEMGMVAEEPSLVRRVPMKGYAQDTDVLIDYVNTKFVSYPLRGGVVVDLPAAVALLKPLFKRARRTLRSPVSLACAPSDASEIERKRLADSVLHAGASRVAIVPEPMVASIGAGIDTSLPHSQVLIDIGDGVTDMAVIRDGRLIYSSALRIACSDFHKAVQSAVISKHRVCLYASEVERLICGIDMTPWAQSEWIESMTVKGIDIAKRREAIIEVNDEETIAAVEPIVSKILKMIQTALRELPEDIGCEVMESGICLTGGGSCIRGMDRLIALKTGLDTRVASDPIHAVINGAIQTVEFWKEKQSWWENLEWPVSTRGNRLNM